MLRLVEIIPVVLEEKMKMWRVYLDDDNHDENDVGQNSIRIAHVNLWPISYNYSPIKTICLEDRRGGVVVES